MRKETGVQWKNGLAKVGRVYYCKFKHNGRLVERSTGQDNLAGAQVWLRRERVRLQDEEENGPIIKVPTLAKIVEEWAEAAEGSKGAKHIKTTKMFAREHLVPAFGKTPLGDINGGLVLKARAKYLKTHAIPSANLWLRTLKLLLNFAVQCEYLDKLPFKVPPIHEEPRDRPVVPNEGEALSLFLAYIATKLPQVQAGLLVAVGMGMRESEILGMKWAWWDEKERTYTVWINKGKRKRVIPVPDQVRDALNRLPREAELIFPSKVMEEYAKDKFRPVEHVPGKWLRKPLLASCKAAGLDAMGVHRLRATFITWHIRKGVPLPDVQKLAGHQAITTTMIYNESPAAHLVEAQSGIDKILSGGDRVGKPKLTSRKYNVKLLLTKKSP